MNGKLYKYRSLETIYDNKGNIIYDGVDRCIDIIKNNRLYFPTREQLNDPYEGIATPIKLGISGEGMFSSLGFIHPYIEGIMNQYRVLSLSGTPLSMQMWAHYAANYKGICFEFGTNGVLGKANKVQYLDKPFEAIYEPDNDEMEEIIKNNFYYKSKNWQYEEEYRIIAKSNNEFIQFDKKELTGIIIGQSALKNKVVREQIIELAEKKKIPVYYTLFTPQEYKLSVVTIDEVSELGTMDLESILYM